MTEAFDIPDDDALAMDFALGALDGTALRAAELRLRRDPDFAADVVRWQADLTPLIDAVAPAAPPPAVWAAVERELFRTAVAAAAAAAPVARAATAALGWWRGLALGSSALAAVAVGLLVSRSPLDRVLDPSATAPAAPAGTLLAAAMASTDAAKAVVLTATYDPARGAVILTPAAKESSRGLTPELWVIVGKQAPRSLGVIDLHGPAAHLVPAALRGQLTRGATLAISLEPAGGSPTGAPTGPVVAAGTLGAI